MSDLYFRIMIAALVAAMIAVAAPHRYRAQRVGGSVPRSAEGPVIMIGLRLAGIAIWLTVLLYIVFPPATSWAMMPLPIWMRLLGLVLGAPAVVWFAWVFRSLGLNVTDTVVVRDRASLVTYGPYRWVRHPLYAGLPWIMLALALLAANWFVLVGGLVVVAFLVVRTRIEEANLVARFGDEYRRYMHVTGRFFPRLAR